MIEITAAEIISFVLLTLVQHESAVVLCYRAFLPFFDHGVKSATATLVVVSVIDLIWLVVLFVAFSQSLRRLARVRRIRGLVDRIRNRKWFLAIRPYFAKPDAAQPQAGQSRLGRHLGNSGYVGILLCGALPIPGLKEIGIVMSLTPHYKEYGFVMMFLGGMMKTLMTLLVYGGLHKIFQPVIPQIVTG